MPCGALLRLFGERDPCVPTETCAACGATTGRAGAMPTGGPEAFAGGGGPWPGASRGGPEPGSPVPGGGPLELESAGAPAVVPIALICASVCCFGDGGTGGAAATVGFGGGKPMRHLC